MIIGLTGSMGCGKGEIVNILEKLGFKHITLSSMIRAEAKERGLPEDREVLMEIGNSMRAFDGAGVLAKKSLEKIKLSDHEDWVIDGIRNPAEIVELKTDEDFHMVGVHTDREVLIDRILSRSRAGDALVKEDIVAKIEREWGKGEPDDGQQVEKCMKDSDLIINNEGTLEELSDKFISYYNSL